MSSLPNSHFQRTHPSAHRNPLRRNPLRRNPLRRNPLRLNPLRRNPLLLFIESLINYNHFPEKKTTWISLIPTFLHSSMLAPSISHKPFFPESTKETRTRTPYPSFLVHSPSILTQLTFPTAVLSCSGRPLVSDLSWTNYLLFPPNAPSSTGDGLQWRQVPQSSSSTSSLLLGEISSHLHTLPRSARPCHQQRRLSNRAPSCWLAADHC